MQFPHIFTPLEVTIQTAAGLGSTMYLVLTRKPGYVQAIILVFVGQVSAYYFTPTIVTWRGWSMGAYGVVGFSVGAFAMLFWGGVIQLVQNFHDDPRGTVQWVLSLRKGGGGPSSSGDKP